jgi:2-amino-4-hydroxy-6-hydroxymethyldihydropteridine diphosphokinase
VPAYVGLGSNLDDPARQVRRALQALAGLPGTRLEARSRLYTSPPLDRSEQPPFVNAVAALLTRLAPRPLLEALLAIEQHHGRIRDPARHWGPRTLDLDLLVYGEERVNEPGLTIPHPGIASRNFVLLPLAELAPELRVPGLGGIAGAVARADRSSIAVLPDAEPA